MSKRIGLINYGVAGNIRSIQKALVKAGADALIVDSPEQLNKVDKLVIPGVGSFPDAMKELKQYKLLEPLKSAMEDKPTLGICLGMQILSRVGFEYGKTEGLGVFDAEVKPIICEGTVPHMGFNKVSVQVKNPLLKGLDGLDFYFMHSYEVVNYRNILALTSYAGHEFVSAIVKEHIYGVQFHPEKSRDAGIELFKNFINL
jgi:imidazole glycerol phosphate synthase glutamine amidotransferase subunit